jgi:V/A-type H+-transporting ATPase subunit E
MTEDLKSLIDKINQEGVQAAETKAKEIENQAQARAAQIIARAKSEADKMLADANERISKMQEKEKALLSQAGRDLLLVVHQELNSMLSRLIVQEVRDSLTPEHMYKILSSIIHTACKQDKTEIVISMGKEDAHVLEGSFLAKLKEETKKEIVLNPSEGIRAGFIVSFDAGKSQFDFSDKALCEYLGTYLKPKLKEILLS